MVKMNGNNNNNNNSQGRAATNIWQVMNYPVPRGKCVHKASIVSSCCPCLRFMLNPLQAASSFLCDGCNHHASFHNLRNPSEEEPELEVVEERRIIMNGSGSVNGGHKTITNGNGSGRKRLAGRIVSKDDEEEVESERDGQLVKRSRN
ncbi:uncharacterized protein LAJ45_08027 [Morchella importuna]|nr:uncharacterized protein LAJ45_08027 [Morchella importuna]KAH8147926.1 hypothetical protein LAJ45_08027 [Morchella importuna]